jgi:hypothetical protein
MNIKIIAAKEPEATDAYAVHQALIQAENRDPRLKSNPQWQCIRMDAYENFARAFEVKQ